MPAPVAAYTVRVVLPRAAAAAATDPAPVAGSVALPGCRWNLNRYLSHSYFRAPPGGHHTAIWEI